MSSYSAETLYQKGDLEEAFLKNPDLFTKYKNQALENAKNGPSHREVDWNQIVKTLLRDTVPVVED